ncbi:MAG: hypothetical protein KGJ23_08065 [Euryarchaeota archaeon]|nr:hypothetical protein [Euryarchaeota archaeon]MDE1836556.1 hypothetical protein [Euryarchaeota archaeon]MDE1879249.1 hypothetical protein [Euryarchaeota archaeon]MDE2044526.1 hypothetical protein [Thermoplasmata archaeon]
MASKKKFYRTIIKVEVLSPGPYNVPDLDQVFRDITDGDCSGSVSVAKSEEVSAARMKKLLEKQDSDPAFFGL